jgi:hypothetical protein
MIANPILDVFNIGVNTISVSPNGSIYLIDKDEKKVFGKITLKDSHVKLTVGMVEYDSPSMRIDV